MKNITLKIGEKALAAVRRHAAADSFSIIRLAKDFLTGIGRRQDGTPEMRQRIRELSDQSAARIGSKTWSRDELHER